MSAPKTRFPLTRRNLVALALLRRGGGTKAHQKSEKALRQLAKSKLKKEMT